MICHSADATFVEFYPPLFWNEMYLNHIKWLTQQPSHVSPKQNYNFENIREAKNVNSLTNNISSHNKMDNKPHTLMSVFIHIHMHILAMNNNNKITNNRRKVQLFFPTGFLLLWQKETYLAASSALSFFKQQFLPLCQTLEMTEFFTTSSQLQK